jgi:hypothetical protein
VRAQSGGKDKGGAIQGGSLQAVDMSHKPWYKKIAARSPAWLQRKGAPGNPSISAAEPVPAQPNSIYDLYPPEAQTVYAHASPQGMQPTGQTQHAGSAPVPTDHTGAAGAAGAHMHPGHASAPGSMGQGQPGQDAQADSEVAEEMKQLEAVMAQPEVAVPSAFQHARHAQCMLCAAALAALM